MRRRMRAMLLALLVVASTYIVLPLVPASATDLPPTNYTPVTLSDMGAPNYVLTQPDGGVTLGCAGGANATKRLDNTGATTHNLPTAAPYPNTCSRNAAVSADGTLFTVVVNGSNGWPMVQAIKDGAVVWTHNFGCNALVRGMVVGTNGNLYVLWTGIWPCGGQSSVTGLAPQPLGGAPSIVMNAAVATNVVDGGIAAHNDGLVLRTVNGLQYVTYAGSVGAVTTVTDMARGGYAEYADATLAGRVVVPIKASLTNQQICNDEYVVSQLSAFDTSGFAWGYPSLPACSRIQVIRPTPSGGVVVQYDQPEGEVPGNAQRRGYLLALGANGQLLWQQDLGLAVIGEIVTFAVDIHGNVALERRFKYELTSGGNTYYYPAVRLTIISGTTGIVVGTHELAGDHDTPGGNGYRVPGSSDIGISHNTWYVPAVFCSAFSCDYHLPKLYAVTVEGLGMDYPKGAIVSPPVAARNYVALGDSFSSGEGVPGFDPATDTAGPPENRCHRSINGAYPKMLAATPSLGLNLTGFVACSGARIDEITNGGDTPVQLSTLNSTTEVTTVSAGGNDVPFRDLVTACLFTDCGNPSVKDPFFNTLQGITDQLRNLYEGSNSIHSQAPNAQVYVVGYPQLLPASGCAQTDGWMMALNALVGSAHGGNAASIALVFEIGRAAELSDAVILAFIQSGVMEFNSAEVSTARSLVVQLNQAIKDAVEAINQPWLVYLDPLATSSPFVGHELCTAQPYFNGLTINPVNVGHDLPYSYHPNAKGQDAYRHLILRAMQ